MNADKFEMMADTFNWSECEQREDRKREREDNDGYRKKSMSAFGQKKAIGLDSSDFQFSSVSMTTSHCDSHHVVGSDSSSNTTMTNITDTKVDMSSNRKRLPKSKKEKKSNRIASLHRRQRKKSWVHELEQTVYAMMKHNHCMEQKNKNLESLLQDAENYIEDNNVTVEVDTNSNINSPTISSREMFINNNSSIATSGNLDGVVNSNTKVLSHTQQAYYSRYQSNITDNSDFVGNCSLSTMQRDNSMCSNIQYNDIQQPFNLCPLEQRQENQFMIFSPINPIIEAILYNMIVNSSHSSRFYHTDNNGATPNTAISFGDDYMNNVSYSRILYQWMEQLNQKEQQQQPSSFMSATS